MKEPRKIVVILGNGFDLDFGLKTSYKDFWESEFCPKDYPAPLINHLNQRWPGNLEAVKWYDLENELLNYYNEIKTTRRIPDVITQEEKEYIKKDTIRYLSFGVDKEDSDAINSLIQKGYLVKHQKNLSYWMPYQADCLQSPIWRDRNALRKIKEGLCKYLKSIDKAFPDSISVAYYLLYTLKKCVGNDDIDIFTFNYTPVPLQDDGKRIPVHYMHGSCENGRIIVGTRDGTPIAPEYDFLQKVMDESFRPPDILTALDNADEIIIFGHSLGENDRQYFEQFFTKQAGSDNQNKPYIFIFTRDSNSMNDIKRSIKILTGDRLSLLYSTNQPIIIRTGELKEDQELFFDFLVDHHTDRHYASEIIGKLLK